MVVLGLDQASKTGFCVGTPGARVPRWGLWTCPDYGGHEGRTFWAFEKWLVTFIKSEGVTHIFWEHVFIPPQARLDTNKLFKLVAFANAIQAACVDEDRGINIHDAYVNASTWRKFFNGHGTGPTELQKQAAMKSCAERGWLVDNHHAAEACGIWSYGCSLVDKNVRWLEQSRIRRQQEKDQGQWQSGKKFAAKR